MKYHIICHHYGNKTIMATFMVKQDAEVFIKAMKEKYPYSQIEYEIIISEK